MFIALASLLGGASAAFAHSSGHPVNALKPGEASFQLAGKVGIGETTSGVRFDPMWDVCSKGAVQLVDARRFRSLVSQVPSTDDCESGAISALPEGAKYPAELIAAKRSGSAHVLVIMGSDGLAEEVHALCVSDRVFAEPAEAAARSIRYEPARCGLAPVRSVILVPLAYDIQFSP